MAELSCSLLLLNLQPVQLLLLAHALLVIRGVHLEMLAVFEGQSLSRLRKYFLHIEQQESLIVACSEHGAIT